MALSPKKPGDWKNRGTAPQNAKHEEGFRGLGFRGVGALGCYNTFDSGSIRVPLRANFGRGFRASGLAL